MNFIQTIGIEDVGTRYQHFKDLLDLWEFAVEMLERRPYLSDTDTERLVQVRDAAKLLRNHIDALSGYSDRSWLLRRTVNEIHSDPTIAAELTPPTEDDVA